MPLESVLGDSTIIKIPTYKDDRNGLPYSEKVAVRGETTKSAVIRNDPGEGGGGSITATVSGDSKPFNEISKALRSSATGATIRNLEDFGVIGPYLTTRSLYFIRFSSDPFPGDGPPRGTGNVAGSPYINGDNAEGYLWGASKYRDTTAWGWHYKMPRSMTLPNCVGGARGRYMELLDDSASWTHQGMGVPPGGEPVNWTNAEPFSYKFSKVEKSGYVEVGTNLYLWQDKTGKYGPKNGVYGYGWAKDGAPPVPGAFITWMGPGYSHVAFIEAVFNFGKDDCYIVISESQFAVYRDYGVLTLAKVNKNGYGSDTYLRWGESWDTKFIYTPLCDFSAIVGGSSIFKQITLSYEIPPSAQLEAYEEIKEIIAGSILKVGDKVQIEQFGNTKVDGSGNKINRLLSVGYVKKIHDSGKPYMYEVHDKKNIGKLIGFFSIAGLHKLSE